MKLNVVVLLVVALLAPQALAKGVTNETSFSRSRVRTVTATVEAIDQKTREVTLKGPDGNTVSFHADKRVKNLKQVKVGDLVKVEYYESVVVYVAKPDGSPNSTGETSTVTTAKAGEMPAAVAENEVTLVATLESIAPDKKSVTLTKADGSTVTLPVKNPGNLEGVHVGDQITIVTSEALAVSVERAKPKTKKK